MKIATRLLLATCLVLPLAACKKEEAVTVEAAPVALVAPAKTDDAGWKAYLSEVVLRNMGDIQVRRLPVLNRDKRLIGIVSLADLASIGQTSRTGEALGGIVRPGGEHSQSIH